MTVARLVATRGAADDAPRPRDAVRDVRSAASVLLGLAAVVGLRWAAIVDGRLDGIAIGLAFGVGLAIVGVAGTRLVGGAPTATRRGLGIDTIVGGAGGLALVGLALVARLPSNPALNAGGLGPATVFGPWLVATTLVALAEELVLRGALFTAAARFGGPALAVTVTSVAFALMHVPVYGWHVVPLDLGVGIFLGGLRLATGRWLAPGIAHVVADLATWWL